MRTAISHNERAIVDYHMRAWSAAVAAQDGSVSVISSVMGISHDEALDLCNMCYDGQSMLDHLGVEVYGEPAVDTYADPMPADQSSIDPYGLDHWFLGLFTFVEWPRFWFSLAAMLAIAAVCLWWAV